MCCVVCWVVCRVLCGLLCVEWRVLCALCVLCCVVCAASLCLVFFGVTGCGVVVLSVVCVACVV